jgi:outer membrane receptor protein involved in Fe transport
LALSLKLPTIRVMAGSVVEGMVFSLWAGSKTGPPPMEGLMRPITSPILAEGSRVTRLRALISIVGAFPATLAWAQQEPVPEPQIVDTPPAPQPPQEPAQPAPPAPAPLKEPQEVSVPGMAPISIGELLDPNITTASRTLERATEAPATVYVITSSDIRVRGYSTLADVLKDLPGMETVEEYYSEQGTLVPVRGVVGNNKIVLLVNGMRVNPPGGEELMIRHDVSVRFADQIEVIYGPGSTLYGQDAISLVVNIKTRRPGDATVEGTAGYGRFGTKEGYASFARTFFRQSDFPVSVTAYFAGWDSNLSDFRRDFPQWWQKYDDYLRPINREGAPVRGDLGLNAFLRLESKNTSLQAWYRDSARSSAEGSGEGGSHPVLFFVPEARWRDRSIVVEGQHALNFSDKVALHSILTFNRYEADPESRYVFPNGTGGLFLQDFKYGIGTSASVEEKLDVEVGHTRFVLGTVGTNYDVVPKTSVPGGVDPRADVVTQAGTLTYYTQPNDPASRVDINRTVNLDYQQFGAYAEGAHDFTEYLRAIAGVRVDKNTRFSTIPFSPRAALILRGLEGRLTLKYIFSGAYVAPAPYYSYNVFDNGVQISAGNPNLKPERAWSNEANLSWRTEHLLLSGSAYYNYQSDLLITSQSEAPETVVMPVVYVNPDGTGMRRLAHSVNLGSSKGKGFDTSFRFGTTYLSGWGSYSYVDFKRTLGAEVSGLPVISRHNVRVGLSLHLFKLSITPSLVLRSTPENLTDTYRDAGVDMNMPYEVNVNALYSPLETLDFFVTARNATNRLYALRGVSGPALQEPVWILGGARFHY